MRKLKDIVEQARVPVKMEILYYAYLRTPGTESKLFASSFFRSVMLEK